MRLALSIALLLGCSGTEVTPDSGPTNRTDANVIRDSATSPQQDANLAILDGGPPPEGMVPMFVAIGKFGRITTSCDDGRTWTFHRSDDDSASCDGIDCDHHPGSSTGLTFGNGHFFASFGWGDNPSRIMRSNNGVDWQTVYDMRGFSFAGLTFTSDRLVGGDVTPRYSSDLGVSFMESEWPDYNVAEGTWPNARRVAYAPIDGGRIALLSGAGDGSWADTTISSDNGLTYRHPTTLPAECRGHGHDMAFGNGVWIQLWNTSGVACISGDGGDTWTLVDMPEDQLTDPVFTGTEFLVYSARRGYRSPDGQNWTGFDTNVEIGSFARDPSTGTYVGVRGGWGHWYDEQRFYRSADGVMWDELPESAARRQHPITDMIFGYGSPSASCPAP